MVIAVIFCSCKDKFDDKGKRNENWAWWVDAKTGKAGWIPVQEGESSVKNGKYTRFYFNGNVYEKGNLVNGKNVDTIFGFDITGHPQEYWILPNDTDYYGEIPIKIEYFYKNGPIRMFFSNGHLKAYGIVSNHTYGNKWKSFFLNGGLRYLRDSKTDTGWATRYYENGKVKDSDYNEGGKIFHIKHWYSIGQLERTIEFKNGGYNGLQKEYYLNGRLQATGNMIDGISNGKETFWYEDGKLHAIGYRKNGVVDGGPQIVYFENGKIKMIAYAKNGKADGERKQFDENGKIIADDILDDGVVIRNKLLDSIRSHKP
ncbi:MAG: toxin-antitoxin system YwqK family antitoxin [Mucilaginibacter sp.]